jgi:hypothetical protein
VTAGYQENSNHLKQKPKQRIFSSLKVFDFLAILQANLTEFIKQEYQ